MHDRHVAAVERIMCEFDGLGEVFIQVLRSRRGLGQASRLRKCDFGKIRDGLNLYEMLLALSGPGEIKNFFKWLSLFVFNPHFSKGAPVTILGVGMVAGPPTG